MGGEGGLEDEFGARAEDLLVGWVLAVRGEEESLAFSPASHLPFIVSPASDAEALPLGCAFMRTGGKPPGPWCCTWGLAVFPVLP